MAVVALHVGGAVGDGGVELLAGRHAAGERAVQPPAAQHPGAAGPLRGEAADALLDGRHVAVLDQVHPVQRQGAAHQVDVGVLEAGSHELALQRQGVGACPTVREGARVVAHVDDPSVGDGQGGGSRFPRPDMAAHDHEVGGRRRGGGLGRQRQGGDEGGHGKAIRHAMGLVHLDFGFRGGRSSSPA